MQIWDQYASLSFVVNKTLSLQWKQREANYLCFSQDFFCESISNTVDAEMARLVKHLYQVAA